MSLQHRVPRTWHYLRLFYKNKPLFREAFVDGHRALFYPFVGSEIFMPRNNVAPVYIPREYWSMLPTASRLVLAGAHPSWEDGKLHVRYEGMHFVAPSHGKMIGNSLREIFEEDVYRLGKRDLTGKVVLDIGAYVGDSSLAFALRGAVVHAFEPLPEFQAYLAENIRLNALEGKVIVHGVGLSNRDALPAEAEIRLVDAVQYLDEQHIDRVDILKLDCEGCEYGLFENDRLLKRLNPREIIMEYHRGGESLYKFFCERGYRVDWPEHEDDVGYMYITADRDVGHECADSKKF